MMVASEERIQTLPPPCRRRPAHQLKMFTALEMTMATVSNDARDWTIINSFAHAVSGIVSVGLNAVAFVNEV